MTISPYGDLQSLSAPHLREILRTEEELNRRLRQDKQSLYTPLTEEVWRFHLSPAYCRVLSGGNQCLSPETKVRMMDGSSREIKKLKPGDVVLGADPTGNTFPTTVLDVFDSGVKPLYCYFLNIGGAGAELHCAEDHKVAVHRHPLAGSSGYDEVVSLSSAFTEGKRNSDYVLNNAFGPRQWFGHREFLGNLPTMDISVDNPYHLFVLENGCIVSNSSKTTGGALETIWHTTGNYPPWYPKAKRRPRPCKVRIITGDYRKGVLDILEPKFEEWFPGWCSLPGDKDKATGATIKKFLPDGSEVEIITHSQETIKQEGWQGDVFWSDEPCPRDKWIANTRGLIARSGICYMTMTLLKEPWVITDLHQAWENGDKKVDFFFVSMDDNSVDNGGYFKQEDIENFCRFLEDDEIIARRHGGLIHMEGRILKKFNRKVHGYSLEHPSDIPMNCTRYFILDPHDSKPSFCAWVAVFPGPQPVALWYREVMLASMTIRQQAAYVMRIEKEYGERIYRRIIDPNKGNTKSEQTGDTTKMAWYKAGKELGYSFSFVDGRDDITRGHDKLREWIYYDETKPVDKTNAPRMYWALNLSGMIRANEKYGWQKPGVGKANLMHEAKPEEKYKDWIDLQRYFVMDDPRYIQVETRREDNVLPMTRRNASRGYEMER